MRGKRLSESAFHKLEPSFHAQVERWRARRELKSLAAPGSRPFFTLSRQFGCEAFVLAEDLAEKLNKALPTPAGWAVYDRALMEKIAADCQLNKTLLESLEKSVHGELDDYLASVFSRENLQLKAFRALVRTVRALALEGHCIIVGRGGAILTRDLPGGVHIRLVAPFAWRAERIMEKRGLTREQAENLVRESDNEREGYIHRFLGIDHREETFYHLIIHSERIARELQIALVLKLVSSATC
ncbi:MAG: cytidylate kinase-like family protein [bacterium]